MKICFLFLCFFLSCSRFEKSVREKIAKENEKIDPIVRKEKDLNYQIFDPMHSPRASYPWEAQMHLPRITKEFFRCKGKAIHPLLKVENEEDPLMDCDGVSRHGLPIIHGREGVYPLLVDLLNYIQMKTGRRVIITCGHRCPIHNRYADPSKENRVSKHQIGAEVDFYVQGMEDRPLEVVGLAMQFFKEVAPYSEDPSKYEFKPYMKNDVATKIRPWLNKELYIKVFSADEGRDFDNSHPYPYICFQVRYDAHKKESVLYSWERANLGYPRS